MAVVILVIIFAGVTYSVIAPSSQPLRSSTISTVSTTSGRTTFTFAERFYCYDLNLTSISSSSVPPASTVSSGTATTYTGNSLPWINYSSSVDGPLCLAFEFHTENGVSESLGSLSLQFPASFGYSVIPPGIPQGFASTTKLINGTLYAELNSTIQFKSPQKLTFILVATQPGVYIVTFWENGGLQAKYRITASGSITSGQLLVRASG